MLSSRPIETLIQGREPQRSSKCSLFVTFGDVSVTKEFLDLFGGPANFHFLVQNSTWELGSAKWDHVYNLLLFNVHGDTAEAGRHSPYVDSPIAIGVSGTDAFMYMFRSITKSIGLTLYVVLIQRSVC